MGGLEHGLSLRVERRGERVLVMEANQQRWQRDIVPVRVDELSGRTGRDPGQRRNPQEAFDPFLPWAAAVAANQSPVILGLQLVLAAEERR